MSFNDYWKDKAAKQRKVWAATARRFADEHAQMGYFPYSRFY